MIRGRRYQVIDRPIAGKLWLVLDTKHGERQHPVVATELSRERARIAMRELNREDEKLRGL